jgi:hypothetical protein
MTYQSMTCCLAYRLEITVTCVVGIAVLLAGEVNDVVIKPTHSCCTNRYSALK